MPSMASTSCAMISGRSGLPKFRQLVAATGQRAHRRQIAAAFRHRQLARPRAARGSVAAVAVERHRDRRARLLDADDGGVGALGTGQGVGAHLVIVLLPDPALGADVRARRAGRAARPARWLGSGRHAGVSPRGGPVYGTVVERRFVGQFAIGNLGDDLAVVAHAQLAIVGDDADLGGFQSPLCGTPGRLRSSRPLSATSSMRSCDSREHDLVRRHAGFALRHAVQFDFDADFAAAAHLARGAGEARRRPCPECPRWRRSSWLRCRLRAAASP